jgi:sodium/potassium-transporting ATPase subunit alpha
MASQMVHEVEPAKVFSRLGSRPQGLFESEVKERLSHYGPNTITAAPKRHTLRQLKRHFTNFFSVLLYVSAVLCFIAEDVQAADIVLLDDNFASIVAGAEEGRTIFANIRRFTKYVLTSNGPEILPYLLYIVLPVPLALTIIQILSIDLGTDIVPAIGLGQEPPDRRVMRQPPRHRAESLLTLPLLVHSYLFLGLLQSAYSLFLFFWVLLDGGWTYGDRLDAANPLYRSATGIALASIVLMQIGNVISRRRDESLGIDAGLLSNGVLQLGIAIKIVFSWAILYATPMQQILRTGPVDAATYLFAWLGIPLILLADYVVKRIMRVQQIRPCMR